MVKIERLVKFVNERSPAGAITGSTQAAELSSQSSNSNGNKLNTRHPGAAAISKAAAAGRVISGDWRVEECADFKLTHCPVPGVRQVPG
jgi:hypothetical protein